jgi:G3E family GTPase
MLHFPSPDIGMFGRRQRHARGHRIPVSIVCTVTDASRGDTVVVHDDFGPDEVLLPETGRSCCTVRMKLQQMLRRLLAERGRRHFNRVVIETRQDIAPILRTFATERALGGEFHVEDVPPLAGNRFTLTADAALSWGMFSRFMATLMALRGADLLSMQGWLNIDGCHGPAVVHCMQHLSLPPVELQAWPDADRRSRVEFVTRGIEEKMVRNLFDAVRVLA